VLVLSIHSLRRTVILLVHFQSHTHNVCSTKQQEGNQAMNREERHGANLFKTAISLGWKDDGEGPLEFLMRRTREVALEDARGDVQAATEHVGWRWKWGDADFWKMTDDPALVPASAPISERLYVSRSSTGTGDAEKTQKGS
jgi:hypothetical protein